jgi:hypothetical protein
MNVTLSAPTWRIVTMPGGTVNTTDTLYLDNSGTISAPIKRKTGGARCHGCGRTFSSERGLRQHWAYLHRAKPHKEGT